MTRAFLYLYFIIVLSVIFVGWGLDQVWKFYIADDNPNSYETRFYQTLEVSIKNIIENDSATSKQEYQDLKKFLGELNTSSSVLIDVISLDDIAGSSVFHDIRNGELVSIFLEEGDQSVYKRIGQTSWVMQVHSPSSQNSITSHLYLIFIIVFYSLIALVVFFWLRPLTRDLKQLENATRSKGEDGLPVEVMLPFSSTIYPLATAYNQSTEKIRDLVASHEEMSYAMSHELRTPLARMKFGLEILRDDVESYLKESMEKAITGYSSKASDDNALSSDRSNNKNNGQAILPSIDGLYSDVVQMDSLISELLNYASFERSSVIQLKTGDLLLFIEHHVNIYRNANNLELQKNENNKAIKFVVRSHLNDSQVICDWNLMERAFLNIMNNALRYTRSNIVIELSTNRQSTVICIDDDGPGIADEDQDRIFSSFVRLRKNREDAGTGFGLGLSIVRRVLHWHNGSVLASRSPLGGARFTLSWPHSN